ncbi:MAG: hypothetical protein NVS2B15_07530 [Pseudarthrobacter sp.]
MHHLAAGVHTGVGAPCHGDPNGTPDQQGQRFFQDALDGSEARLERPPAEGAAVVRQIKPDTQKPAAP